MAIFNKFNSFVANAMNKKYNLASDQLTVALCSVTPAAGNNALTDITQIAYTNLSSRNVTTVSSVQSGGLYKLTVSDLVLTASGAVASWRYVVLYDSTATGFELIGWYDFGSAVTMGTSDAITLDFDQTNGALQLQ